MASKKLLNVRTMTTIKFTRSKLFALIASGERLTVSEEATLRTFYESKLLEICVRVFLCPEKVTVSIYSLNYYSEHL